MYLLGSCSPPFIRPKSLCLQDSHTSYVKEMTASKWFTVSIFSNLGLVSNHSICYINIDDHTHVVSYRNLKNRVVTHQIIPTGSNMHFYFLKKRVSLWLAHFRYTWVTHTSIHTKITFVPIRHYDWPIRSNIPIVLYWVGTNVNLDRPCAPWRSPVLPEWCWRKKLRLPLYLPKAVIATSPVDSSSFVLMWPTQNHLDW